MKRLACLAFALSAALLAGCSTVHPVPAPEPHTRLVLVLVGGNSESVTEGGVWKLYRSGCADARTRLPRTLPVEAGAVATHYYSWTGDDERYRERLLPGHWDWITGGAARIEQSLAPVLAATPGTFQLAIVGWSNGGATAYELACRLALRRPADLLVTLDPVAWTTRPCADHTGGRLQTPPNWLHVYTASTGPDHFDPSNIIAFFGRAWDEARLPSRPAELHPLKPANHGDTCEMWDGRVLPSATFRAWAEGLKPR